MNNNKMLVLLSIATAICFAACTATPIEPLSDHKGWNGDFMRGAQATTTCPTDTIANAKSRMLVDGPFTIEQYEKRVAYEFTTADEPDRLQVMHKKISDSDKVLIGEMQAIYEVSFHTDPFGGNYWGFSGYVVVLDGCVVHVSKMGYIN